MVDADEPTVRRELAELPDKVARIDRLISDGVIGGDQPNAADLQIAATMRLLLMLDEVGQAIDGGQAAAHARSLFPEPFGAEPIPWVLPEEWLEPLTDSARS